MWRADARGMECVPIGPLGRHGPAASFQSGADTPCGFHPLRGRPLCGGRANWEEPNEITWSCRRNDCCGLVRGCGERAVDPSWDRLRFLLPCTRSGQQNVIHHLRLIAGGTATANVDQAAPRPCRIPHGTGRALFGGRSSQSPCHQNARWPPLPVQERGSTPKR